jgi:hypothetical protein
MKIPGRFIGVVSAALFLTCAAANSFAQSPVGALTSRHVKKYPVDIHRVQTLTSHTVLTLKPAANPPENHLPTISPVPNVSTSGGAGGNISGLVTVPAFVGAFAPQNGPSLGNVFPFVMIGNDPLTGGTTTIPADMTEVSLQLLNADGTVFTTVPYAPFSALTTHSPNFANFVYDSSTVATQFGDAVQRAEFFSTAKPTWHTKLKPQVVNQVTITVPYFVNVQLSDGTIIQARSYFTGTAADGSTFVLMLDLLFNFFFDN